MLGTLLNSKWAVYEPALKTMVEIYIRNGVSADTLSEWKVNREAALPFDEDENEKENAGNKYHYTTVKNGIGIMAIDGPMFKGANLLTKMSGATSYDFIKSDIAEMLDDPEVKGILMSINSPGGEALGIDGLSELIFNARSVKPVWSHVDGLGASAGYWLATSASKVLATKDSLLGSIGVVTTVGVQEKPDADGVRKIEIVSSNAENKRPNPLTEKGMYVIKKELDDLEAIFHSSISRNRGVSFDKIKSDFGGGAILIAQEASNVGMIDGVASFEQSLNMFKEFLQNKNSISNINSEEDFDMTDVKETEKKAEEAKTFTQEEVNAMVSDAKKVSFAEGIKAESDRLASLEKVSLAGHEKLLEEAKCDTSMTAEKLALKIIEAEKSAKEKYMANLAASEKEAKKIEPTASADGISEEDKEKDESSDEEVSEEAEANAIWNKNADVRKEFSSKETFVSYFKAEKAGRVRKGEKENS